MIVYSQSLEDYHAIITVLYRNSAKYHVYIPTAVKSMSSCYEALRRTTLRTKSWNFSQPVQRLTLFLVITDSIAIQEKLSKYVPIVVDTKIHWEFRRREHLLDQC